MAGLAIQWYMDQAAILIGDPAKQRVTQAQLLVLANLSLNDLCTAFDILEIEDDFDVPADKEMSYPDDCTRVIEITMTATPADANSFAALDERFPDEYRREGGRGTYPVAAVPERYLASQGSIRLLPMAEATILNGGIIRYYGVPEYFTDPTVVVPLPNFLKSFLLERVIIYALEADRRLDESRTRLAEWHEREESVRDLIEDRSLDRQTSLRPESARIGNRDQA